MIGRRPGSVTALTVASWGGFHRRVWCGRDSANAAELRVQWGRWLGLGAVGGGPTPTLGTLGTLVARD